MNRKISSKIISLLLLIAVAAAATGCSKTNADESKATEEATVAEAAETIAAAAETESAEVSEAEATETETDADVPYVIFDTDMSVCQDDLLAMQALFALQDQGKCKVAGVALSAKHEPSRRFMDCAMHYYKADDVPFGFVEGEAEVAPFTPYYTLADEKKADGTPLLEGTGKDVSSRPAGWKVYREALSKLPDKSAVIICVGMASNIGELLDSEPDELSPLSGRELVEQKVKTLYLMAGCFKEVKRIDMENEYLDAEFNVLGDIPLAKKVIENWPGDLVLLPIEAGLDYPCIQEDVLNDYASQPDSLMYLTAERWDLSDQLGSVGPYWWDPITVSYALDPQAASCFAEPVRGSVTVSDTGITTFEANESGNTVIIEPLKESKAELYKVLRSYASFKP